MPPQRTNSARAIRAPQIPARLVAAALPTERLEDHEHYHALALEQQDLSGQTATRPGFDGVRFTQVNLSATHLREPQILDVRFQHCNFANAEWPNALLQRVEVLDCRLTGFTLVEGKLRDVRFKDCHAELAKFRFMSFNAVRFDHCLLVEADFHHADLSGVVFAGCDLRNAEMSGAKLAGADLRGCLIDGLRVGLAELRGAIVDPAQAIAIVRNFGLTVEWSADDPAAGRAID
jgi:uncharacterized protein YjbI with pentapeptide repeats